MNVNDVVWIVIRDAFQPINKKYEFQTPNSEPFFGS